MADESMAGGGEGRVQQKERDGETINRRSKKWMG